MYDAGQFACLIYSSPMCSFTAAVFAHAVCVGSPGVHWVFYVVVCFGLPVNLLETSGLFTYSQVLYSKVLHGARFALSVLYGFQNRQRLLLYTSLTDWFL
jgi:hypothetical protein